MITWPAISRKLKNSTIMQQGLCKLLSAREMGRMSEEKKEKKRKEKLEIPNDGEVLYSNTYITSGTLTVCVHVLPKVMKSY